jgi:hypothetical protein
MSIFFAERVLHSSRVFSLYVRLDGVWRRPGASRDIECSSQSELSIPQLSLNPQIRSPEGLKSSGWHVLRPPATSQVFDPIIALQGTNLDNEVLPARSRVWTRTESSPRSTK